jgi:uncharacterized membrane protein YqaE (UPF0057 family)
MIYCSVCEGSGKVFYLIMLPPLVIFISVGAIKAYAKKSENISLTFSKYLPQIKAVQIRGTFHPYPLKLLAFWTSFDRFPNQVSFFFLL